MSQDPETVLSLFEAVAAVAWYNHPISQFEDIVNFAWCEPEPDPVTAALETARVAIGHALTGAPSLAEFAAGLPAAKHQVFELMKVTPAGTLEDRALITAAALMMDLIHAGRIRNSRWQTEENLFRTLDVLGELAARA